MRFCSAGDPAVPGSRRCPAVDAEPDRDQHRGPAAPVRAGRGCPPPWLPHGRGHRPGSRPIGERDGRPARLREAGRDSSAITRSLARSVPFSASTPPGSRAGQDLDGAPCRLHPQGPRHARLPFGGARRRLADHARSGSRTRGHRPCHPPPDPGRSAASRAGRQTRTVANSGKEPRDGTRPYRPGEQGCPRHMADQAQLAIFSDT